MSIIPSLKQVAMRHKYIISMLRRLLLATRLRLSSAKETPAEEEASPANPTPRARSEYLLFPTNYPVPPYYFYSTKINARLQEYITKHNIKYVAAFPIRPAVHRHSLYPTSVDAPNSPDSLQSMLGLDGHVWPSRTGKPNEPMGISDNNVMYDGQLEDKGDAPLRVIRNPQQLYPMGTVCNVHVDPRNSILLLRSEIRLEADWWGPEGSGIVSLVSGKSVKAESLIEVTPEYESLLEIYNKIKIISTVNLPSIETSQKSVIKVLQLLTGYLTTNSYFSQDTLYRVFQTTAIDEKIKLLLRHYQQYHSVLEEQWKQMSHSQANTEKRQKEAVETVYDTMKRMVGNAGEQKYIDKIKLKLKERKYPEHIKKLIEAELSNLQTEGNHDVSRKKHYINLLSDYPFGVISPEVYDVLKAKAILEEDHYGMKKLKQRILEFIAVSKLKGEFKSKVLLLHGPPGVGKTSIVKSIAKCLNRPYARVSLGGQYDTSIIKGHRKTYVGAYPGKIWDSIFKAKAENPVILLDEVDKIMNRANGASLQDAVMQVLDPVQNDRFKDDFMDVEIDLSKVLFICTANTLDTIFPPLLDRLERIEVTGYTTPEKMEIFKRYIIKQSMEENGIDQEKHPDIDIPQETVTALIEGYCKEAGVRSLVRKTNKIFQKLAYKLVKDIDFEKRILPEHLRQYLGLPLFYDSRLYHGAPPPGVMIGLAYNNYGGSIMYIECADQGRYVEEKESEEGKSKEEKSDASKERGSLLVTGNIHDVMKQSCQLASTYAKFITANFFNSHYLEQNHVHLNFPEIEIGKDGPSAGVAITSALISLALDKPMQKEIGMTGEITLSGRVGAIGGVKEKTMGAKREGITTLIFPEDNRKDVDDLEPEVKEGMTFHFAKHYFDVMELLFGIKLETENLGVSTFNVEEPAQRAQAVL